MACVPGHVLSAKGALVILLVLVFVLLLVISCCCLFVVVVVIVVVVVVVVLEYYSLVINLFTCTLYLLSKAEWPSDLWSEPWSQAWEACMMPLHDRRFWTCIQYSCSRNTQSAAALCLSVPRSITRPSRRSVAQQPVSGVGPSS